MQWFWKAAAALSSLFEQVLSEKRRSSPSSLIWILQRLKYCTPQWLFQGWQKGQAHARKFPRLGFFQEWRSHLSLLITWGESSYQAVMWAAVHMMNAAPAKTAAIRFARPDIVAMAVWAQSDSVCCRLGWMPSYLVQRNKFFNSRKNRQQHLLWCLFA